MQTETIYVEAHEVERDLTVADRCDRCSAQAFFAMLKDGAELLFCGHHGRTHAPALADKGWTVLDFTERINDKPADYDD